MKTLKITVADIDHLMECYEVREQGHVLGGKSGEGLYSKPSWTRQGRSVPWNKRDYKAPPPWLKYEIVRIEPPLRIIVRKPDKGQKGACNI